MPAPKQQTIKSENYELFHLSVRSDGTVAVVLDRRFDIFPVALTSMIAKQIEAEYSDRHVVRSDEPFPLITYDICGMEWIWPRFAAPRAVLIRTHNYLGLANLTSLNGFRTQRLREVDLERAEWVQLAPSVRTLNPQFNHLHSLRVGDVGWGFDREGCVSIAIVKGVEGAVHRSSVYVQKIEQIFCAAGQHHIDSSGNCKRPRTV